MTRDQLIDRIRAFNPTATAEFLAQFTSKQLKAYLGRLAEVAASADPPRQAA